MNFGTGVKINFPLKDLVFDIAEKNDNTLVLSGDYLFLDDMEPDMIVCYCSPFHFIHSEMFTFEMNDYTGYSKLSFNFSVEKAFQKNWLWGFEPIHLMAGH